jgi:hypothetical protein
VLFVFFMLTCSNYVSQLRPTMGLVFIPQLRYENGEPWWNDTDRGKQNNSEKTYPSANLSITNPTRTDLGLHSKRLATNNLSHGMACHVNVVTFLLNSVQNKVISCSTINVWATEDF